MKLFKIEYLKLKHSKAFWILIGLYILCISVIAISGDWFLSYLSSQGVSYKNLDPTIIPIYDFVDIWQNLAYMGSFFKIFPAFFIIISIGDEFSYKTNRQNVIDGLSRSAFLGTKIQFAAVIALFSGLLLLVLGFILGFVFSPVSDFGSVIKHMEFIPAHMLQLFTYLMLAILLILLLKRTGIVIALLLFYTFIFEPILSAIIEYKFGNIAGFLPLTAINEVVRFPFSKYVFLKTQEFVSLFDLFKCVLWLGVFWISSFILIKKRDL